MAAAPETCYRHPGEETGVHCTRCGRPICPACMTVAPVGHHCPECVAQGRRQARRRPITLRRPRSATTVILGINVAVFVAEMALGGATDIGVLVRMGAMVPVLVAGGEYWRLLTAMFLHVGIFHLALNSLGLYIFGSLVEGVLGSGRFIAVYLVSGLCASAASFAFGDPVTAAAGASGAIFGLLGAWLAYNVRRRSLGLARSNIQGALMLIALNLVFGFTVPGIDNTAHLGGLAAGVVAGFAVEGFGPRRMRPATQVAGLAALVVAASAVTAWRVAELAPLIGA
ncbi:MAG TPA: rhomboid family intramembrane serine protease [Actinomycetota bacterium]|nr:rhomboid family intramembrane serine protease [Actinomycetota bacterium]